MYIRLPSTYVDPKTKAPLPEAVLVIQDADFKLRGGSTILQIAVYANAAAAAAGADPTSEASLALSPVEIQSQLPALLGACYNTLLARPTFAGACLVTP